MFEIEEGTSDHSKETDIGKIYVPLSNREEMSSGMINGKTRGPSPIKYNGRLKASKQKEREIPKMELYFGMVLSILSIMAYYTLVLGDWSMYRGTGDMILYGLMIAMFVSGSSLILYWGAKYNGIYEEEMPRTI